MSEKDPRVKAALGGKKPAKKKKSSKKKSGRKAKVRPFGSRDTMTIGRTANNKFNARHTYMDEPAGSEDHGLSDLDELHQHIDDHLGGQAPAPAPAAAPMPTPGM